MMTRGCKTVTRPSDRGVDEVNMRGRSPLGGGTIGISVAMVSVFTSRSGVGQSDGQSDN